NPPGGAHKLPCLERWRSAEGRPEGSTVSDWPSILAIQLLAWPSVRGSIRERSPGSWQLRAFEGTDPLTGKKLYRTKYVRGTKREAQKQLALLVTEVNAGVVAPAAKSVAVLLDAWIDHIEHLGRSPSTLY